MVVSNRLIHPVNFLVRVIEGVSSSHLEHKVVSAQCRPHVIDVSESYARLTYDEWICWGRSNALCHVWLEIIDGCAHEEDVIPPSCNNRIRTDSGVTVLLEVGQEQFSHIVNRICTFGWRSSYE